MTASWFIPQETMWVPTAAPWAGCLLRCHFHAVKFAPPSLQAQLPMAPCLRENAFSFLMQIPPLTLKLKPDAMLPQCGLNIMSMSLT